MTVVDITAVLEKGDIKCSVPMRVDMGGTLDISIFNLPLRSIGPKTFNLAVDMRTNVTLSKFKAGFIKISSRGFKSATFKTANFPLDHSFGLFFAVASYFGADGVQIHIDSSSPPKSGLGGSSAAAVALVGAFSKAHEQMGQKALSRKAIVNIAHAAEQSVAGVPCGLQDQLGAAFGGVNQWTWTGYTQGQEYSRRLLLKKNKKKDLDKCLLFAYCGIQHESADVNGFWVKKFKTGKMRDKWVRISDLTSEFAGCLASWDMEGAARAMNAETDIRRKMTPGVLVGPGKDLVNAAKKLSCGARFTGAGGGGCIWAIGNGDNIETLKPKWADILNKSKGACLLDMTTDWDGLI